MNDQIQQRLRQIEQDRDVRVLYACESGSRAWGFASTDSDYDVRFIYTHDRDWYLSIYERADGIELGVDEENIDLSGWDLRKALRLFLKSNAVIFEWLYSPIVYFQDDTFTAKLKIVNDI